MKTFFENLFTYNHHCNQQLAAILSEKPEQADVKSMSLFSHMLNAHQIWNNRILGQPTGCTVWESRPSDTFAAIDRHNFNQTITLLGSFGLTDPITYKTSDGRLFVNTVGDILFHVINHSTYHRGQIALLFRQNGMEPLITDYIFYKR
ncbi:DinB family protein [Parapedobacter defluvii]|uniref:DinB family protein n=1 Tax=Parapedobacter defluvii TaxID=2045106 RepID=UPI00333F02DF